MLVVLTTVVKNNHFKIGYCILLPRPNQQLQRQTAASRSGLTVNPADVEFVVGLLAGVLNCTDERVVHAHDTLCTIFLL